MLNNFTTSIFAGLERSHVREQMEVDVWLSLVKDIVLIFDSFAGWLRVLFGIRRKES